MEGSKLVFRGLIASPDGTQFFDTTREGNPEDAVEMGRDAGMELKVTLPPSSSHYLYLPPLTFIGPGPPPVRSLTADVSFHFAKISLPLPTNLRPRQSVPFPLPLWHTGMFLRFLSELRTRKPADALPLWQVVWLIISLPWSPPLPFGNLPHPNVVTLLQWPRHFRLLDALVGDIVGRIREVIRKLFWWCTRGHR